MNDVTYYDAIVVGAGYAGLTAAHELIRAGRNVLVLEARDRIGGRVYTQTFDDGTYLDLGGAWIGPTQDRIYKLAREFGVETFPTYDNGQSTQAFRGKIRRYNGLIPPLPLGALLSLDRAIKQLNKLARTVNLQQPWATPNARQLDSMTLASWMDGQMIFETARRFLRIAVEAIWAADPCEISLLHALFYIRSGRDLDTLMNIRNGAQEERFVGGAQTVANRMADQFRDRIQLRSPVRSIVQTNGRVEVVGDDFSYTANRVIVAIPPVQAARIDFQPLLPTQRELLTQRVPMGSAWKCYAVYEKPFWRDKGYNGLAATPDGHVTVTFDNSPPDGSRGILLGFVLGNQAKTFATLSEQDRRLSALHSFGTFFGLEALRPLRYVDHSFMNDEWVRGCYAGIMGPGVWTDRKSVV